MIRHAAGLLTLALLAAPAAVHGQADLTDTEMAHVAVTASNIDIAYAHLALAFSEDAAVREFAQTMIRDHSAVNEQVVALAERLGVEAQDNALSRQLLDEAARIKNELSQLRGEAFDRRYIENEVRYHRTVNNVVEDAFIPNIENAQVKRAFQQALALFKNHQRHAESLAENLSE